LGLSFAVNYENGINITRIVGILLLLIGIIRFSSKLQSLLGSIVKKNIQMYYVVIGFVHGVSNMGGGPLSILMSTIYSKKEIIRANIAFIYLILAISQLIVLFIISDASFNGNGNGNGNVILLIPISLISYFFASKFISTQVNNKKYAFILNAMVLIYGILAVIK